MRATKSKRWIAAITKEAETCTVDMPWARGARRAAFIVRRSSQELRQSA